ncbi:F-box-like domain superfamily [Sesbania bispinosa]|nr:F-box-like domain superfamily [Sesbania bispinosa]
MKKFQSFLNNDIMFDVLSRIPAKLLLGLKCISRDWHHTISSRAFIKAQLENTGLVLTGFILQEKFMWCKVDIKAVNYIPVETIGARVQHMVFNFLPEEVVVLASCKGIVCCRSCLPSREPTIYVCNPSNKEWIQLKWPAHDRRESIALAFDFEPSKDSIDISYKFKLVRVKQVENMEEELFFTFELYSSETRTWRKSNEICQCHSNLIKNKGIYIGGVLHWLTDDDQVLTFDVEKELSWLISVPVPSLEFRTVPEACIGESEGRLHYVQVSEEGLHVWYLEDYYEFKWTLKHSKSLEEIEGEYPHFFLNLKNRVSERVSLDSSPWMNPLGFKDGVLLMKVSANLFMYDIKKNKMAQACSILDLNPQSTSNPTVLPHSLSLVPLNHA